jgi:hypothetical protein
MTLVMLFRIRKGTHVSHFHDKCPLWPTENFYEQERPLWWGNLCEECLRLSDREKVSGPIFNKRFLTPFS